MDTTNALVENERQFKKSSGQWGMSNLFQKKTIFSATFLTKTGRKKLLAKNITASRSTETLSIDWFKNISISKLTIKTGLKNIPSTL